MSEPQYNVNGLANLLTASGTLHSIPDPPDRDDFESDEDYEVAYDDWYWGTVAWTSEWKPL